MSQTIEDRGYDEAARAYADLSDDERAVITLDCCRREVTRFTRRLAFATTDADRAYYASALFQAKRELAEAERDVAMLGRRAA